LKFLLDTNLVSEPLKPRPNPGVLRWLAETAEDAMFLSVATLAELRHGIERLPESARKRRLDEWLGRDVPHRFFGRTLPVDDDIAHVWGILAARRDAVGRPIGALDGFLAATCAVHQLTLVSRDVADFAGSVARIVNPWT